MRATATSPSAKVSRRQRQFQTVPASQQHANGCTRMEKVWLPISVL